MGSYEKMFKILVSIIQKYVVVNAKNPPQQVGTSENSTALYIDPEYMIQRQNPYYFPKQNDESEFYKHKEISKNFEHDESADEEDKIPEEVNRMAQNSTFLNIFVLSILGLFFLLIVILLCLGSNSCVKRFFLGRQRIRKALQYRPSKYKSRVTPSPSCSGDSVVTPPNSVFQMA